jgi:hypothetical protein
MDHAEVLDRLESAMVEPGKLRTIDSDESPEGIELRDHLASCESCAGEYRAWWAASRALEAATPDTLRAPAEARARILAAARASGRERPATSVPIESSSVEAPTDAPNVIPFRPRAVPGPAWIALAAAAAVLIFVLGAFLGGPLGLTQAEPQDDVPAAVAQVADRIIRAPDHRAATLIDPSGQAAGSLLFDPASSELLVLTEALPAPASGGSYDCYLERAGERTQIGRMQDAEGLSYWAGPIDEPSDAGLPGDRFVVALDENDPRPVLVGDLGVSAR